MRIAEINMFHMGSTGKIMLEIAKCARESGHEVQTFSPIVYQRRKKVQHFEIAHHSYFGWRRENMLHWVLSKLTGFHGCFSVLGTRQLLKQLDRLQPDIIHLHNLHNWTINIPLLFNYIKKHNISVVWTLHDCWSFTGQCPYFDLVNCDKWKTGCYRCPQIHEYPQSYVDRTKTMWRLKKKWFTGVQNMTIVTPSQWLGNLVKVSFLKDYPVRVINNGIDLNVFKPTESDLRKAYGLQCKKIILGVAFGWDKRKGLDVFVELAKRLDEQYQIILVGTDSEVDKQLPYNIISIHRTQNQKELAALYSLADIFVNPTREEVLGMVNVEALACGTPVITFNSGGSPECIDKTCGKVVECDDVDAMEREIRRLCFDNEYDMTLCKERAKHFDNTARFEEYVSLYSTVIGR